ncbi:hypothetical protein AB0J38_41115 [Streptomyces sp. NPDC050095]|uniref:hypothetical protein n=1 Tax=unclassified Streptomyces TaxID=2593676 RepID=UPI00343F3CD7
MARKVITKVTCDACAKQEKSVPGTVTLTIMEDEYDLCDEHGGRFREQLSTALGIAEDLAVSA